MKKQTIKINYETQYIYGVKIVCKDWIPENMLFTFSSPDENGFTTVLIQKKVEDLKR